MIGIWWEYHSKNEENVVSHRVTKDGEELVFCSRDAAYKCIAMLESKNNAICPGSLVAREVKAETCERAIG